MDTAKVNGIELEYEVVGSGEPVLLISPVLADGFVPLVAEPALADRYQLIRYHKRGWVGSTHTPPPVGIGDHAADAAALLDHLGVPRAHVAGHSSGGAVAAQLALDDPATVHTLMLLELSLLSVPSGEAFLQQAGPAFEAYGRGDHERALAIFMGVVSGLDWAACRAALDEYLPGSVLQAIKDADTFFGIELPALTEWEFGPAEAAGLPCPVLSVFGTRTQPLWVDVADFLRRSVPQVEDCPLDGVGHLLHIERPRPVAVALADFVAGSTFWRTSFGAVQLGEKVMRSLWIVASTAVLVVGAACSGGGGSDEVAASASSTTAPTVPPEPSTTVPPPPLSTEAAAERYLAIVEPYNVAWEALEQGINGGQAVETLQVQAAGVAAANDTHRLELEATVWPADVQPVVDELVAACVEAQTYWAEASQAPTRDALITAVLSAAEHDGGEAAATIRSLLGLGAYNEEDYT